MKMILAMLPTIFLVVCSQLLTKWRVGVLATSMDSSMDKWERLICYLKDPFILSSYGAALSASMAWMFVVERYPISIAFPIYVGLTIFAVAVGGSWFFGEEVTTARMISMGLIVLGVAIGARG